MEQREKMTGYPSIDKPWLKCYDNETVNAPLPDGSMFDFLYAQNHGHEDEIAIKYYGATVTFRQLFDRIDQAAGAFQGLGVKEGDPVLFCTLSMPETVYALYAVNRLGARCNFVNVLSSPEELHGYINECGCEVAVCLDLFSEKMAQALIGTKLKYVILLSLGDSMPTGKRVLFRVKMRSQLTAHADKPFVKWSDFLHLTPPEKIMPAGGSDAIAIIGHTGGTTGFPKSVQLTNRAMNAVAFQCLKAYTHERRQTTLAVMVPQSVYGLSFSLHMPLCLGVSLAIVPRFNGADWPKYIKWYHPNHIAATPPYLIALLDHDKIDLSSFITIAFGGDGMTEEVEHELNEFVKAHGFPKMLVKGYGLSEMGGTAFMTYNEHNKLTSVGIPLPKNDVMIWDEETQGECSYQVTGEVCIRGPGMMTGYEGNERESGKALRKHANDEIWFHSGDLGHLDEDGFLYIDGRMKRIIMSYRNGVGGKVYPERVEKVLSALPAVERICVIGVPDKIMGAAVVAYVVLRQGCKEADAETGLRALCEKELPEYARPIRYVFRTELPLTPIGKVDYLKLEQLAADKQDN